jgi:hypothetical protein
MTAGTASLRRIGIRRTLLAVLVVTGACGKADPPGPSPLRVAMGKIGSTHNALNPLVNRVQNSDPPWDTIQARAKERADLAVSLTGYDPPRGSKDSWAKQTLSYAEATASLDRAARAKNKDGTLAANKLAYRSCQDCHQAHRGHAPK